MVMMTKKCGFRLKFYQLNLTMLMLKGKIRLTGMVSFEIFGIILLKVKRTFSFIGYKTNDWKYYSIFIYSYSKTSLHNHHKGKILVMFLLKHHRFELFVWPLKLSSRKSYFIEWYLRVVFWLVKKIHFPGSICTL